jgi:hypothetical protein
VRSLADMEEGPGTGSARAPRPLLYLSCPRTTPAPCVVLCMLT